MVTLIFGTTSVNAATTTNEPVGAQQKAMFIMDTVNISQGMYGSYSHQGSKAIDLAGKDGGTDPAYAPFDGKVVYMSTSAAYIIYQSLNPVEFADGTVDYMTVWVMHDDNVGRFYVGQTFSQGQHFFNEGSSGYATGNHIHLECAKGTYEGQYKNGSGVWCIKNQINPYDALFLSESTNIINGYGYNWRRTNRDTSAPTISNARAENISANSFDIKCDLYDDVGVTRVWMIVYSPSGESQFEVSASNGSFSYTISTSNYGGIGEYAVGFYAYDAVGNSAKSVVEPIYVGARFKSADAVNLGNDFIAEISHVKSGKKISTNNSDNVIINSINGSDNQKWHFTRYSDGSYKIANCQTNKCLDVAGGRTENETNIQVYQSNESVAQKWYIIANTYGYGLVPLSSTSSALDIYGGNTADGTNAQQYYWNQGGAQNFTIDYVSLEPSETAEYNGHKYEFYYNNTTWYQAYRTCEKIGGHLVTITSDTERDEVLDLTKNYSGKIWIGATIEGSQNWYWINSETYTENNYWATGEPNNTNEKEKAVEMYISGAKIGQWNDISGNTSSIEGFVCEYDDLVDANNYEPIQSVTFGEYRYDLYEKKTDWQTAKSICEKKGGTLTDIGNESEQAVVNSLIQKGSKTSYWIGLSDVENEGVWKWCNGNVASYKNWADNEPNNAVGIEECVSIYRGTGKWNDYPRYANGYNSFGFVCKTKITLSPINTISYNSHRYELYLTTATFPQAMDFCEKKGGHLVTITSKAENDKMLELTDGYSGTVWIGASKFNSSNWYWINSETYIENNLWAPGEPNNEGGNELFVKLYISGSKKGQWNDIKRSNTEAIGFICEYDDLVNPDDYTPVASVKNNGYEYELYDYQVDWQTAQKICKKKGGNLVDIANSDENDLVWNLAKKGSKNEYWIGLSDLVSENDWKWVNGQESQYYNWLSGQPNNDNEMENYVALNKESGQWYDFKGFCNAFRSVGFICKTPLHEIGDTNLDNHITIGDVTAIQRHIAELDIFSDEQLALADTNGDGEINITDATHLQKYIAKFDGIVLGKQPA